MEYSTTNSFVNGTTYKVVVHKNKDGWTRTSRRWTPGSLSDIAAYNVLNNIECHEDTWRLDLPVCLNKLLSDKYLKHKLETISRIEDTVLDCTFEEPFETVSIDQRIALSRTRCAPDFGYDQNIVSYHYCIPKRYIDQVWEESKLFCSNCITENLNGDEYFEIWASCDVVRANDLIDEVCNVNENWCSHCQVTALFSLADFDDDSNLPIANYGITRRLQRILV